MDLRVDSDHFLQKIQESLETVLEKIASNPADHPSLRAGLRFSKDLIDTVRNLCLAKDAKRIRPRLVHLFGQTLNIQDQQLVPIATAAELIHSASLLHDDVVDEGTVRRGYPTANALHGNQRAVLVGDLLFSQAFFQLKSLPKGILDHAIDVIDVMSRAAAMEVDVRGNLDLALDDWCVIAEGKTGALFGWCGEAVGILANDPEAALRFLSCGKRFGIIFQMADDVKDFQLMNQVASKDPLADLRTQTPSFPILMAVLESSPFKTKLQQAWSGGIAANSLEKNWSALGHELLKTSALEKTIQRMSEDIAYTSEVMSPYRNTPGGRDISFWIHHLWQSLQFSA